MRVPALCGVCEAIRAAIGDPSMVLTRVERLSFVGGYIAAMMPIAGLPPLEADPALCGECAEAWREVASGHGKRSDDKAARS